MLPDTECPLVPFPLMGGSADSEGTAGVMLTIITSVTRHTDNVHWRVEPIIVHLYTWFTVCVSLQIDHDSGHMTLVTPPHCPLVTLMITDHW